MRYLIIRDDGCNDSDFGDSDDSETRDEGAKLRLL
jgi:hypothetical protein